MYAWIVRETDHDMIKREMKKYNLFFNGVKTLNQFLSIGSLAGPNPLPAVVAAADEYQLQNYCQLYA